MEEMAERLGQTEQLVAQLKELIREKDAALCSKDQQLKVRAWRGHGGVKVLTWC